MMDVYGFCPNRDSSSTIDDESPRDHSNSDGGYLIETRLGNNTKVSAATSYSFDLRPHVTDASDLQYEKQDLQSASTNVGTLLTVKPLLQMFQFSAISSLIQI
jgi:hypothetical protein